MRDVIERQAVIDALKDWYDGMIISSFRGVEKVIKALPSAQPEIIRCKDCKHYEWDKLNDAYCCLKWGYNFPNEDDFCSRAERRIDD